MKILDKGFSTQEYTDSIKDWVKVKNESKNFNDWFLKNSIKESEEPLLDFIWGGQAAQEQFNVEQRFQIIYVLYSAAKDGAGVFRNDH